MPNENESVPAPDSIEAQALAELEKEGNTIEGKEEPTKEEPKKDPEPVQKDPEPSKEKKEDPVPSKDEDKKPDRKPTMVETWKLHVAEDQKDKALKEVERLQGELKKLTEQKASISEEQKDDIADEIKRIAEETGVDPAPLSKLADVIIKRSQSEKQFPADLEKTVKQLQEERELEKQMNEFSREFDKDVSPLLSEYQLTGEDLSKIKDTLRDYAFSETYQRVPLKEIFAIKQAEFNLSVPKKSAEGKGIKSRGANVVDIDNMSEEDFKNLPADKVEEFIQKKSSGSWSRR